MGAQLAGRDRANAPERLDRQLLEKWLHAIGRDHLPWMLDAVYNVSSNRLYHRHAERFAPGILRHVKIRFIERERLDERRHLAKNREHRIRRRFVAREIRRDDHERWAEPYRSCHRHRRVHAERARPVARRRHDASSVRLAADGERLTAKRRVIALFHRRVEGVHVDVKNPPHEWLRVDGDRLNIIVRD